ncbi:MAG: cytidylate kinase-like family protein [Acutalibacter sp.]|jgi:cytidylate kinase|nr:cytidylate kinase-like family protein [Acutalibacter sp.]
MLPVITISRQFGSGGHEVGERLARELNVPFYDKALIAMAAKQSGLSEEVFANADEKATSSLLYSMVMGSYSFGARVPGINEMPINDKLFIIQSDIIKKAAAEGPCVVIGRCADYILREHENCLNVFIHANKEDRIRRSIAKKDCEERKASDFVTKKDKQRANYYNFYSNKRWDDLQNYDITIDTSRFSIDQAVGMLIDAAHLLDK